MNNDQVKKSPETEAESTSDQRLGPLSSVYSTKRAIQENEQLLLIIATTG